MKRSSISPRGATDGMMLAEAVRPTRATTTPTLAAIVQQKVAADISSGVLAAGSRLEETELAQRYNVSRTPVREALRQLAALGMVDFRHRHGVVVTERSAGHFRNLLEIVADLEAAAARYAAQRMTETQKDGLAKLHAQIGHIAVKGQAAKFDKANLQLHQLIHEGARNEILFNGIVQMRMRTLPYTRAQFISERKRIGISHMEHNAIVQAILAREPELAYHAMRLHVIDAGLLQEDKAPCG